MSKTPHPVFDDDFWRKLYDGLAIAYVGNLRLRYADEDSEWAFDNIAKMCCDVSDELMLERQRRKTAGPT